jgi:hypothetical protein
MGQHTRTSGQKDRYPENAQHMHDDQIGHNLAEMNKAGKRMSSKERAKTAKV